jgi:hypothetical protein
VLHAEPDGSEIDGDQPVPFLLGDFVGRAALVDHPRIVDGVIQAAEVLDGARHHRARLARVRHVGGNGERLETLSCQSVDLGVDQFRTPRAECDVCAGFRETGALSPTRYRRSPP